MKNKLDVNSKNSKKDLFELISQVKDNFFQDINLEIDFSQWWIFILNWDKEKRLSRKGILLSLFDWELSINDFILSIWLDKLNIDVFTDEKYLHLMLYKLLEEFLEKEGIDEFIIRLLNYEKNKIYWYIEETDDIQKKLVYEEILWESHPMNTAWHNVKKSIDWLLKK